MTPQETFKKMLRAPGAPDVLPERPEGATDADYQWQPFTENFDYLKEFYDVKLPDGTEVKWCWPNAGKMNAIHGASPQRQFTHLDNVQVRLSPDHPEDAKETKPRVLVIGSNAHLSPELLAVAAQKDVQIIVDDEAVNAKRDHQRALNAMMADRFISGALGIHPTIIERALAVLPRGRSRRSYKEPSFKQQIESADSHESIDDVLHIASKVAPAGTYRKLEKAASARRTELFERGICKKVS